MVLHRNRHNHLGREDAAVDRVRLNEVITHIAQDLPWTGLVSLGGQPPDVGNAIQMYCGGTPTRAFT